MKCAQCPNRAAKGRKRCRKCLTAANESGKRHRDQKQAAGLCPMHGCRLKTRPGYKMCRRHCKGGRAPNRSKAKQRDGVIALLRACIAKHERWIERYRKEIKELERDAQ